VNAALTDKQAFLLRRVSWRSRASLGGGFIGFEPLAQVGIAGAAIKYVAISDMVKMIKSRFIQPSNK
jgi:hypothetical protein